MWKNNNRGKKAPDWRGRGRKFGNNRRIGTRPFNSRRSPNRTRTSQPDNWGGEAFSDDKNLRYNAGNDDRDVQPFYEDNRQVIDRQPTGLFEDGEPAQFSDNYYDGPHRNQFNMEQSERDGFRSDDIGRFNNADDMIRGDVGNQNLDHYPDRRDDFIGHDQDRVYNMDRDFDNTRYRPGDYNQGNNVKYEEQFTDNVGDIGMDHVPDWRRLGEDRPVGEVDQWNRDNSLPYDDTVRVGLVGYDNQSMDTTAYANTRDMDYSYGESDRIKSEYRTEPASRRNLSGDRNKSTTNDRRDNRGHVNNQNLVGNSLKQNYRRNDSAPLKQGSSKSVRGSNVVGSLTRHRDTNTRHRETTGKQSDRSIKTEKLGKSDQSRRSLSSSHNKGNKIDMKPNTSTSTNIKHSKDVKESSGNSRGRNIQSSKSSSQRDETGKTSSSSKGNQNKSSSSNRSGQSSNRPRSASNINSPRSGPNRNQQRSASNTNPQRSASKTNPSRPGSNTNLQRSGSNTNPPRTGSSSNPQRSGSKEDIKRGSSTRSTSDNKNQRNDRSKADNDSFKKPPDRQQHNTTGRSNSGRRLESDFGHHNDDDILSIMAEDDGFDNEHKFGNANTSSVTHRKHSRDSDTRDKGSSNRNTRGDRQNSKSESDRNMEPVFEIHAESSASIFEDYSDRPEQFRSSGKNDGNRLSSSRDRSRDRRTGGGVNKNTSDDRRKSRSTDKSADRYSKVNRDSTSKSAGSGRYGHVREELGKTGAVLREDRTNSNDNSKVNTVVQKSNFQGNVQNFKTGPRNGNQFSKSGFRNKNFTHSDRVKRKYLRGGLKSSGYDRDTSRFQGNRNGRKRKGRDSREAWKPRADDRNKRSDGRIDNFVDMNSEVHDKNENRFDDFPLNVVEQPVDSNQQIVFIPNQDMKSGVPAPMVDQFGRVIYNADMPEQPIDGQIPVQYISEQYPTDGGAVGEQFVFIPFVNQMSNYSDNISNPLDNAANVEVKPKEVPKKNTQNHPKSKPLSKVARAILRKRLEVKKKKRMEEAIERKVLKKIFGSTSIAQAVKRGENIQMKKKKPVIRRISPPAANKPTHINKTVKLVKKKELDVVDVSEEEEDVDQYDSVSDLEDVSDEEDYDKRNEKRPVFRKPGQPRKGNTSRKLDEGKGNSRDYDDRKSHDIRRVVQSSSNQHDGRRKEDVHAGQKRQRAVYEEEHVSYTSSQQSSHKQGQPSRYGIKKSRRSMSPIEITVSNERYSKTSSTRQRTTDESKDDHKRRPGDFDRKMNTDRRSRSLEDQYDNTHGGRDRQRSGGRNDVKRSEGTRNRVEENPNKFEARRNVQDERNFANSPMSNDRQGFGYGKYRGKNEEEGYTDKARNTVPKYRDERNNNYRSDNQSEWEMNVPDNGRLSNKNQNRSIRNDIVDRAEPYGQYARMDDASQGNRSQNQVSGSQVGGSPQYGNRNIFRGSYQTNSSFTQQSGHSFNHSHSMPLQFSKTGSGVDHSLPPVQNTQLSIPPFPPASLGVRPDMSLPPPVGTMDSQSSMMQSSNAGNFQQNYGVQSQPHYPSISQQYPQQQSMQTMPHSQSQFQMHQQQQQQQQQQQPMYEYNHGVRQNQIGLQHMQPNQYQQTQSNAGIMSTNQNLASDHVTSQLTGQVPRLNQGSYKQVTGIKTSHNQQAYVTTNSQGVRGVIGTLKTSGTGAQPGLRVAQVETGSPGHTAVIGRATVRSDVKQSPTLNVVPADNDAYFEDLVQMVCSKCNRELLDHSMMKAHGRWHDMIESNNTSWRCDQCEQGYQSSAVYEDHMSHKHTYNAWNCSLCNLSFSNSSGLNKHIRHSTHKNLKVKFVCSLCPASFMVLTHLIQHKKEIHQSSLGYASFRKF